MLNVFHKHVTLKQKDIKIQNKLEKSKYFSVLLSYRITTVTGHPEVVSS